MPMTNDKTYLRTGDLVKVRSPDEIDLTLDADGTLDGLPFMPEMLDHIGRCFRVLRRAEKTCVHVATQNYDIREFRGNDVVLLDGLRCPGSGHDGCQRLCTLFWKAAWLQKVEPDDRGAVVDESARLRLRARLKTTSAHNRYFCQSTELAHATVPLPRLRILWKCICDIRSGSRGLFEMSRLVLVPLWRKMTERFQRPPLAGTLTRTPTGSLNLQPGDYVEIKSAAEIAQTLDSSGRNRGLMCDHGMCKFSGGTFRVHSRLDRMISELTGQMHQVPSTVILDQLECLCWNVTGGCPRQDLMYWRELWLNRAGAGQPDCTAAGERAATKMKAP